MLELATACVAPDAAPPADGGEAEGPTTDPAAGAVAGVVTKILTYHVVSGKLEASDLTDGKKLKTVEGEDLTVKKSGDSVMIVDAKGGSSTVTIPDVNQSNGVIHVVDTVLMPAS